MKSELTKEFLECFRALPDRVKQTARKNYWLWKQNPRHPGVEFKKLNTSMKDTNTIVWSWIGPHSEYDKLLRNL
jgi:hypothetical protein